MCNYFCFSLSIFQHLQATEDEERETVLLNTGQQMPFRTTGTCDDHFRFFIGSPEPKAQVSFSDQNLSVIRVKGIQVCSNEGPRPFPRGDNFEIVKIH